MTLYLDPSGRRRVHLDLDRADRRALTRLAQRAARRPQPARRRPPHPDPIPSKGPTLPSPQKRPQPAGNTTTAAGRSLTRNPDSRTLPTQWGPFDPPSPGSPVGPGRPSHARERGGGPTDAAAHR